VTVLALRRGAKRDNAQRRLKDRQGRFKYDRASDRDKGDSEEKNDGWQA
jgi:hypothetical protein